MAFPHRTASRAWLLAVVLAAGHSLSGIANHPLHANDEPRVAGIAWEMQHGGHWLVPYLAGQPFLEHPPLFYSVLAGAFRVFGASDVVARLPVAIAALLTLLLVFDTGRRVAGDRAGLAALLALVAARGFYRYGQKLVVDPLLMLFVMTGFWIYARILLATVSEVTPQREAGPRESGPGGAILAVYAAAALAFQVKGFIGIVAIAGPIAADVLLFRRFRLLLSWGHVAGLPLLVASCLSWPALLHHLEGQDALREFLMNNGLYRMAPEMAGGTYHGGHERGATYYLGQLHQELGALVLLAPAVLLRGLRGGTRPAPVAAARRFLTLVLPVGVLLLSIPGTKRGLYLLPFLPPFAVATGLWIAEQLQAGPVSRVQAATRACCAGIVWMLALPLRALLAAAGSLGGAPGRSARALGRRIAQATGRDLAAVAEGPSRAPFRLVAIVFAASLLWTTFALPHLHPERNIEPLARQVAEAYGADPVVGYRLNEALCGALAFYTGHTARDLHPAAAFEAYLRAHPGGLLVGLAEWREPVGGDALELVRRFAGGEVPFALYRIRESAGGAEVEDGGAAPVASGTDPAGAAPDR